MQPEQEQESEWITHLKGMRNPLRQRGWEGRVRRTGARKRLVRWRPLRALPLALFCLALIALIPGVASAHAYYVSSGPPAGAVLKTAPSLVTVHFAEHVNPQGSDIIVYDARHKQVSTAPAQVSRTDLKTMTVPMAGDGDGTYLVEWHTVSADDGDPDIGAFNFVVSSTGSATPVATSTVSTGVRAGGGQSSAPAWVIVLVGLLGLAVGAAGGFYAARGSR